MAVIPSAVPTLDTAGWVRTPDEKIDWIFSYFFETMQSQSNEARQFNISFQEILQRTGHDRYTLSAEVQRKVNELFGRYFPNTDISVQVTEIKDSAGLTITISGRVFEVNGKEYVLAESLEALGTNFKRIMKLNN